MKNFKISKELVQKISGLIDKGLTAGLGDPEPGKMCVEAVICYALEQEHDDNPKCVNETVGYIKIDLNDSKWGSNKSRAKGMKKLAIAQLGSKGVINNKEFANRLAEKVMQKMVPRAILAYQKKYTPEQKRIAALAAKECEQKLKASSDLSLYTLSIMPSFPKLLQHVAALALGLSDLSSWRGICGNMIAIVSSCADIAKRKKGGAPAYEKELVFYADLILEVLKEMKSPGVKWLKYI